MNTLTRMSPLDFRVVAAALCLGALATTGSAQILFQEDFNNLPGTTTLGALGWQATAYNAPVHVNSTVLSQSAGDYSISGSPSSPEQIGVWLKPFAQAIPANTRLLTLSYDAYATPSSHNSGAMLNVGTEIPSGQVGWWISNHPDSYGWVLDARGAGGSFAPVVVAQDARVTATTYVSFTDRTIWGTLAVERGSTFTSPVLSMGEGFDPTTLNHVYVEEDWRYTGNTGLPIDNILVTAEVPEPGLSVCAVASLLGLFGLVRAARRHKPQP